MLESISVNSLFRVSRAGNSTTIQPFAATGDLFSEREVAEAVAVAYGKEVRKDRA